MLPLRPEIWRERQSESQRLSDSGVLYWGTGFSCAASVPEVGGLECEAMHPFVATSFAAGFANRELGSRATVQKMMA